VRCFTELLHKITVSFNSGPYLHSTTRLRVSENIVLRGIFGHRREEVAGGWKGLREALCSLYTSQNIIRVINSRMMRWERACSMHKRDKT